MLNHTSLVQKNVFIFYFWHPTHARTTRYEEAFSPEGQNGLGRFAPSALPHYSIFSPWLRGNEGEEREPV